MNFPQFFLHLKLLKGASPVSSDGLGSGATCSHAGDRRDGLATCDLPFLPAMTLTEQLPNEALSAIFLYLNARESIGCRGVCKRWSHAAGAGCLTLRLRGPSVPEEPWVLPVGGVGSVALAGTLVEKKPAFKSGGDKRLSPAAEPVQRVRGHLPQPATLSPGSQTDKLTFASDRLIDQFPESRCGNPPNTQREDAMPAGHLLSLINARLSGSFQCAIRIESLLRLAKNLVSLDLSSSASTFEYCITAIGRSNVVFDEIRKGKKPRHLRSSLEELDVSYLHHLKQLSVRGCGNLQFLNLNPSLRTLDAGGCSNLIGIDFPRGASGFLSALDLGGCRNLRYNKGKGADHHRLTLRPSLLGPNTVVALSNITNLDMSHVCKRDALDKTCCDALRLSKRLESFSLRYGATDDVLIALAESESARSGKLRLVDVAFSKDITDKAVEALAKNASSLERLNLRGCKKVSSSCYNHVPVYLERRRRREGEGKILEEDESYRSCTRKGDNLFYFCQKK